MNNTDELQDQMKRIATTTREDTKSAKDKLKEEITMLNEKLAEQRKAHCKKLQKCLIMITLTLNISLRLYRN